MSLCICSEGILSQIKKLLNEFNIETGKTTITQYSTKKGTRFRTSFSIMRRSYEIFKKEINFSHPNKSKKLDSALRTQKRQQRTRDPMFIEEKILQLLEIKPSRTMEIADYLLFTLNGISPHLGRLEKEGQIIKRGYRNKIIWDLI